MARAKDIPQYGGLPIRKPRAPEAPRLPHFPKIPHVNHGRGVILFAAVMASAGLLATATAEKDIKIVANTVPGETDNTMSHPYGEPVNISINEFGGTEINFTNEPQVLRAISFNVEGVVPFINNDPKNPQTYRIEQAGLINASFVPFFGEGKKEFSFARDNLITGQSINVGGNMPVGDIWLMLINNEGDPINASGEVLSEGHYPLYTRIDYVNLDFPKPLQ